MNIHEKSNNFFQEGGAIFRMLQTIGKNIKIAIEIEYAKGYFKKPKSFAEDPVP